MLDLAFVTLVQNTLKIWQNYKKKNLCLEWGFRQVRQVQALNKNAEVLSLPLCDT